MRYVLVVLAVLVLACERTSVTPAPVMPNDDEDTVDACKPACQTLRTLSCPEGFNSVSNTSCEATCARALQLRALPLECWAEARSVVELRSCGSIRCVR